MGNAICGCGDYTAKTALPMGRSVVEMYTIRKAAALLGIPDRTLRGQMKRCGVGGKLINADGNRVYLSHEDMIKLIGYSDRKRGKRVGKQIVGKGDILEMKDEDNDFQDGEKKAVYAIREAALIVGVSLSTMREWVLKHNIKKLRLNTDRKRVY